MYARGAIFGLTRDTGKEHLVKATLESLAYQSIDLLVAMQEDSETDITTLKVDGGASANNFLMQFQADILKCAVERPENNESTALGAAYLAGIEVGLYQQSNLKNEKEVQVFKPSMSSEKVEKLYKGWKKAIERTMDWEKD